MEKEQKNKLDLLGFQKNLNEQFLEIFEDKKSGKNLKKINNTELGLIQNIDNYQFFFPLKSLKNISSDNKVESISLTKSWIMGFNQVRGDIYTIIDFSKIVEYIFNNNLSNEKNKITNESNILYIKEQNDHKLALVIDSLSLKPTTEYTQIFKTNINENQYRWELNENIDFYKDIKEERMTNQEWNILNFVNEVAIQNNDWGTENIQSKIELSEKEIKLFWILISDIYIEHSKESKELIGKPLFVVDMQRLTNFLMNVSPF